MGGRFSIRKLSLELLVIVCLAIAGWTGYQLFVSHGLEPVLGSIVFIVDIGVLVWNVAVLRSNYYRRMIPSFKLVFIPVLIIVLILAFAGIQPLSGYKDNIVSKAIEIIDNVLPNTSNETVGEDNYTLSTDKGLLLLSLVGQWEGEGNKEIKFNGVGPFTVDIETTARTPVGSDFSLDLWQNKEGIYIGNLDWCTPPWYEVGSGSRYFIVGASGDFKLVIESCGCSWKVRVGKVE